jgi:hypothetical protein
MEASYEAAGIRFSFQTAKPVIVRLDRTIQYAAASRFDYQRLWNTGSSAGACHRAARCADPVADDDG